MTRLEATIVHWEEQLANAHSGEPMQITSNFCPLCDYYYEDCTNNKDETCPIALETGNSGCVGSPWRNVDNSLDYKAFELRVAGPNTVPAVKAELAFLKSLPDPETTS